MDPGFHRGVLSASRKTVPACVVHPVPLKLRRLVEGISSGPDDSRDHGRDIFSCRASPTRIHYCNRCSVGVVRGRDFEEWRRFGG